MNSYEESDEESIDPTEIQKYKDRARFFSFLCDPNAKYTYDNFPFDYCEPKKREEELLNDYLKDAAFFPAHFRHQSEECYEELKKFRLTCDNIEWRAECFAAISKICDVPWLSGRVEIFKKEASTPPRRRKFREVGGLAEVYALEPLERACLGTLVLACAHCGWDFNSVGTTHSAVIYSMYPYDEWFVVVTHITLNETGAPQAATLSPRYHLLQTADDLFNLHKLLFWLAAVNGGKFRIQQEINPDLVLDSD
eukprot:Gregarina_sp_Pseudo_9__1842@NODE_2257_length_1075_cov_31_048263_g1388_i1_p1_GENE_NODE_2257_length_1075_cov_31_048263_g1388_i1NODE_2257_length_1075_cov_31_048263_g1388_i1_p1_ORF_typecomplete_len252_score25_52_NODE_2257_length_1075_cov_31_048263_g1388_i160815